MSRRRAVLASVLLTAPLLAAGLAGGSSPALAVTGSPPVTVPDDAGTTYPGNALFVDPLSNDSDPDKDELALCRSGSESYRGVEAAYDGFDYVIYASPKAKPGTYTFTYYACDFSYLTAGTVSVTVEKAPKVRLVAIEGRPGYVRIKNPADFAVKVYYGSFREGEPDGIAKVKAEGSEVIRVRRERIDYVVYNREDVYLRTGRLSGIDLPGGTRAPATGRVPAPRWWVR